MARLRADGSGFDYSTFFGGPDFVSIQGLWLGSTETWVAGDAEISSGAVFPAPGGYDTTPNGLSDAFVARFGEGPPPVMVTVTSVPAGRIVKVDDRPVVTPFTFAWQLPLSSHILDANAPQGVGSAQYDFVSWSQGGSAVHMVPTPSSPTTYTVTYALSACTVTPTPASAPVGFEGGQLVFRIDATPGCNWTAGPLPNWVQGAIPPPGSPNLQGFPLIVEPNPGAPRTASIQVGGSTITVVQDGTNAGLPAPTILSPAQGAALRDQSSVKLSWAPIVGASRYDIRVLGVPPGSAPSHTVFHGTNAANTTSISLPNLFGNYRFLVRACNASGCGAASSVDFNHVTTAPVGPGVPGPVVILSPATGQVLTSSTHEFRWARAELATRYLVQIKPRGSAVPEMQIVTRSLSTVYTLRGLPEYELQVTPCGGGCTTPTSATFSTNFPPIPTGAPTITSAGALSGNSYRFDWTAVPGADVYRIQIVQPTSGPGGGALTVASTQTAVTNVALSVPAGAASALVAACNGRGCGPYSAPFAINPPGPSPAAPVLGQPISVLNIDGPLVLFTWNRVPGDNGSNTVYRLYAQDLSRNEPALDVQTTNNFYAGLFAAEGRRYDALVVANPGAAQATGPAVGFIVQGTSSPSPTPVIPTHESTVRQGDVRIGWTPIGEGARFYQYAVYRAGEAAPVSEGMLQDLQVILPLPGQGAGRATSESCAPARSRTRQCASSDPTPGGGRGRMLPAVLG